jgi:alginate O-acetyltransferase complex protein AlgI
MLFCSWSYLVFFLIVFSLYWAIPKDRFRVYLLLAASYFFYSSWNSWLALLIFASATFDYFLAISITKVESQRTKKFLVAASVTANLGLLCYFKYMNFFLDSLRETLEAFGASPDIPVLEVILPIGISFYTFEAINYVVDVYRGHVKAERNLANLLLFVLFFPHLVAGPIVRARDFLPQILRRKRWSWRRAQMGIQLILLGLIKKLVIADRLALLVDPVFADPEAFRSSACWLAVFGYALQLYGDFSGYSDLAMGSAYLLGYHLVWNFRMPFLSANLGEFWRRWHISLSTWLRDYVFFPLGGSRCGYWTTCRNLLLTMTLCGLWHGATWNCVLFGLLHGVLLIIHRTFRAFCDNRPTLTALLETQAGLVGRIAFTFFVFCMSLIVFRSPGLASIGAYVSRMVTPDPEALTAPLPSLGFVLMVLLVIAGHALAQNRAGQRFLGRLPPGLLGAVYGLGLSLILLLAPPAGQGFIYFQF